VKINKVLYDAFRVLKVPSEGKLSFLIKVLILFFLSLGIDFQLKAQLPNANAFNTGTNATYTGTLPVNSNDLSWTAAMGSPTTFTSAFVPAKVIANTNPGVWVNSPYPNVAWINYPAACPGSTDYSYTQCYGNVDEYFQLQFNLPTSICGIPISTTGLYCLNFQFYADNAVSTITVNGVVSYSNTSTNQYFATDYNTAGVKAVSLCNNWKGGLNSLIVHVKSGPNSTGFLGQINQAITTINPYSHLVFTSSSKTNVTCMGGHDGAAIANPPNNPTGYTYLWSPTGQTTQLITGLTVGSYTVQATDSTGCFGTSTVTITQPPAPTASISGNTTVCQNTTFPVVTFTGASGFAPYKFVYTLNGGTADTLATTIGTTATITQSTTLQGTFTYSLLSVIDAHGCSNVQNGKVVVRVNPLPIITSTSDTICRAQGRAGTLVASGANSYSWSTGAITNSITQAPLATTTYTVIGNSLGCLDTAIGTIKVNPLPVVTSSNDVICKAQGRAGTLTVSGANTYLWSTGATTNSITVAPLLTSTYSVTGTTLGCTGSSTSTITVNPIPVVTVAPATICFGQQSILTANSSNSYQWSTGATTNTINVSPTATATYTVIGNSLGCFDTTTATITVNALPIVKITSDTICDGQGRAGILQASGANSYLWQTGATTYSISASPNTTTTYSVVGNSLGCLDTATATIKVNPLPILTITLDTICKAQGRAGTITVSGANSYLWSTGATTSSISDAPLVTMTYTVTGTTLGCFSSATSTITVNPIPVVTVAPATICIGQSVTLTAASANLYRWSTGATTNTINISPAITSTYSVIGNSLGCLDSTSAIITVNPLPIVTATSDTICNGQGRAGILKASGADTYVWSTGAATYSMTASPNITTTYTVTGNTLGCLNTAKGIIKVNPLPPVSSTSKTICRGQTATLVASGAASYLWSNGVAFSANTVSPASTTTYTLTGTTLGCFNTVTANVTVNPYPIVTVNSATVCTGGSATLKAVGANSYLWSTGATNDSIVQTPLAGTNYTVTGTSFNCSKKAIGSITVLNATQAVAVPQSICFGDTTSLVAYGSSSYTWSYNSTTSSANPLVVSPKVNTTYTVIGLGCPNSGTVTVSVLPLPIITVLPKTICEGNTATLLAKDSLHNISTYIWSTGSDSASIIATPKDSLTIYTVVGATVFGCKDTTTVSITVKPNPVVSVNSAVICPNAGSTLTAVGAVTYLWSTGATTNFITASPITTTSYSVTGYSPWGCSGKGIGTIKMSKNPTAGFIASPSPTDVFNTEVAFSNTSSVDVVYWHWDYGDGNTLAPNTASPIHTYAEDVGTYTVTLIVHNATPCWDTISSEILIGPEYAYYIPNSFTPNGDKNNNGFRGVGIGIVKYKLEIFDRWGQFIWQSTDLDEYWDGIVTGGTRIVQEDVYVWKVFITDVFGREHHYIGTVTVVK